MCVCVCVCVCVCLTVCLLRTALQTSENIFAACRDGDEFYSKEWAMNPEHDVNQTCVTQERGGGGEAVWHSPFGG